MLLEVKAGARQRSSNSLPRCGNTLKDMGKKRAAELLAENLKRLMEADADLSNGPKLAKASGVSQKTINNIERARKDPRLSSIEKIARAYGTEAYLFLTPGDENLLQIVLAYTQTDARGRELLQSAADAVLIGANGRARKTGGGN